MTILIWTQNTQNTFEDIKTLIAQRVQLTYLDPAKRLCLNTNASEHHWAGILTNIPMEDVKKPQTDQRHEPLAFVSGSFSGAMAYWPICEKEAFTVVNAMAQTEYYTVCSETSIYTDHRNLIFIFDALKSHPDAPAYWVYKIQRWALILSQSEYVVSHVPGELNYFPDLMKRRGVQVKMPSTLRAYSFPE